MELIQDDFPVRGEEVEALLSRKSNLLMARAEVLLQLRQFEDRITVPGDQSLLQHQGKLRASEQAFQKEKTERQSLELYHEAIDRALEYIDKTLSDLKQHNAREEDDDDAHPLSEYLNGY